MTHAHPDPGREPVSPSLTDSLRLQNARLAALHEVALSLTSTLELSQVLQRVVEMAQSMADSANAIIFLYDPARDDLYLAAGHWSPGEPARQLRPRHGGVTHSVALSGQPVFIEDTAALPDTFPAWADPKPGALACLPLVKGQRILGTLNLGYWKPHTFDPDTRGFLDLMARHAAIAIEQARLLEMSVDKARLEREMDLARQLQASLIPRQAPKLPGWDIAAFWQPATLVAGDYYDFITSPSAQFQNIVVADVADKGMPAALFMALTRSTIRGSMTDGCCPSDAIDHANRLLYADSSNGMFVTAFLGQLNPANGELLYVNAGHNPPLHYRRAEDTLSHLEPTGIALAILDNYSFAQCRLQLEPGDFILSYTDGITDALDAQQREFGLDCLQQAVLERRDGTAAEIIAGLEEAVSRFVGDSAPFDDMTAVVVKRNL